MSGWRREPLLVADYGRAVGIFSRWRTRIRFYGACPVCGHDWREHPGGSFDPETSTCGECVYEVEHGQRSPASRPPCTERAPQPLSSR
jgi:hypothetical protein